MNEIQSFILAGGASRRMKRHKAFLTVGGKTFLELAANALAAITAPGQIFVVGNNLPPTLDLPVLPDVFPTGHRASLIGLYTALCEAKTDWLAVLACDLPFVSGDLLVRLDSFPKTNLDAVVPLQPDGKPQPLCAFYRRRTCLHAVELMLGEDVWKARDLLQLVHTRFVTFAELSDLPGASRFFINVNTPEEYEMLSDYGDVSYCNQIGIET